MSSNRSYLKLQVRVQGCWDSGGNGVKEALGWIKRKAWCTAIVETDCYAVVQAIRSKTSMPSYYGSIIRDCRELVSDNPNVLLCFVKRSANRVAVARASYYVVDRVFRRNDFPLEIIDVIMQDCQ